MISFEDFAIRAKLDLYAYFRTNGIFSDESLKKYCLANNMIPPSKVYFPEKRGGELEPKVQSEKPVSKNKEVLKKEKVPAKTTTKRKTRTTRKKTTRTAKTQKK